MYVYIILENFVKLFYDSVRVTIAPDMLMCNSHNVVMLYVSHQVIHDILTLRTNDSAKLGQYH